MFSRLRAQAAFPTVIALIALFFALGGASLAEPVADSAASLGKNVKKALRIGERADKNAKRALSRAKRADRRARQALARAGQPGPKGDKGDPGAPGAPGAPGSVIGSQVFGKVRNHPGGNATYYGHFFGTEGATLFPGDSWMHSPQIAVRLRNVRIFDDSAAFQGGQSYSFQLYVESSPVAGFSCTLTTFQGSCTIPGETVIPAASAKVFWAIQAAGNAQSGSFTVTGELLPA